MWPENILIVNRKIRTIGRIENLTNSMKIIKFESNKGQFLGQRWITKFLKNFISKKKVIIQKNIIILKLKFICLVIEKE